MSTNTATGNESPVMTEGSTADAIETFVSTVTDALSDVGADDNTIASVKDAGQQLTESVSEIETEVETLRDDLAEARDDAARERAEIRSDLHEVKETVESQDNAVNNPVEGTSSDANGGGNTDETATTEPVTALGDCITIPEPVAGDSLSANQKRARDVATDVVDYGRSVPAGYAITSSELRTVLTALKDGEGRTYTETVGRVIEYLDDLGEDHVTVKETMGGQRTVIFSEELVKRTVAWRNQSHNGVVTDETVTG